MIAIIRIRGLIGVRKDKAETMFRLGIRRKFTCVLVKDNEETHKMLVKINSFIAYGKINKETLTELIKKRGSKKVEAEKVAEELLSGKNKLEDFGLKPFFRLHPPRGGIETKYHFPKGILGNNKEKINELIMRML